jgi:hypothetical protein
MQRNNVSEEFVWHVFPEEGCGIVLRIAVFISSRCLRREQHYWDARPWILKRKPSPGSPFCRFVNTTPTIYAFWKDQLPIGWVQKKAESTRSRPPRDLLNPALIYAHPDKHHGRLGPIDYVPGLTLRTKILMNKQFTSSGWSMAACDPGRAALACGMRSNANSFSSQGSNAVMLLFKLVPCLVQWTMVAVLRLWGSVQGYKNKEIRRTRLVKRKLVTFPPRISSVTLYTSTLAIRSEVKCQYFPSTKWSFESSRN